MITLKQEQIVRACITDPSCKLTNTEIAEKADVSRPQVVHLRRVKETYDKVAVSDRLKVANMLKQGFSAPAIETILKIPKSYINAVRRWEYLQRRRPGDGGPIPCPCCKHILYGDEDADVDVFSSLFVRYWTGDDSMQQVISDLVDLEELHLIRHPLFYYLAQRAKKVLEDVESPSDR
jgi:hypothetical protein